MNCSITEIKGNTPEGKRILIITGIHGNEITSIYTGMMAVTTIGYDLKNDFAIVTIINGVNESGIQSGTREVSEKSANGDMNRMFHESTVANVSKHLKEAFTSNRLYESLSVLDLKTIISQYDIVIDIHTSADIHEFVLIDNNEYADSLASYLAIHNIPYCIRAFRGDTLKSYIFNQGKVGFTLELNGLETIDFDSARKGYEIVVNLIKAMADFQITKSHIIPEHDCLSIVSHYEGLITPLEAGKTFFEKGDLLFDIIDYNLNTIGMIVAPCRGRLISKVSRSYTTVGADICLFQPIL